MEFEKSRDGGQNRLAAKLNPRDVFLKRLRRVPVVNAAGTQIESHPPRKLFKYLVISRVWMLHLLEESV